MKEGRQEYNQFVGDNLYTFYVETVPLLHGRQASCFIVYRGAQGLPSAPLFCYTRTGKDNNLTARTILVLEEIFCFHLRCDRLSTAIIRQEEDVP